MKLSIIIPVYNEYTTLEEILRRVRAVPVEKEIILVDDGSSDGSEKILEELEGDRGIKIFRHSRNRGKGAAIITGLQKVEGDVTLIQDADLEYDPAEYPKLLAPFERDPEVQVVYGSRILRKNARSSLVFYWGGRMLSLITNLFYGSSVTDEPTGYKVFRTKLLKQLNLESTGFEFCPEVTAKILLRKIPICEIPISYSPRSWAEGKKIRWTDGLKAIWILLKYRLRGRCN
tara:strand:+ start:1810 stop:2502 length:693 start_codon:yes stop_codon:yes gene_type:complete